MTIKRMMQGCAASLAMMMTFPATLFAQTDGVTLSGSITFEKTGTIYVKLVTAADFERNEGGGHGHDKEQKEGKNAGDAAKEDASPFKMAMTIGDAEQKAKSVPFTFTNVPKGAYVITAFQDENGNGKLDEGMFGPKEPWGMSQLKEKPKFRAPKVEEVKFDVTQDMTNMTIELR